MLIDWFTVAAQIINFLILVWLLKRFLYKPVLTAIDEREKRIAQQLQEAETKKAEALKERADFAHKNEEFDRQRAALLVEATNSAKTERNKLIETARHDSEELRAQLQKAVDGEFDSLKQNLGALAQDQVFSISRKTLSDLAGVSLEERMTDSFVRRLQEMPASERGAFRSLPADAGRPALISSAFELGQEQRTAIEKVVRPILPEGTRINFEAKPELISGIELTANGQKVAWSISGYLASMNGAVETLLKNKSAPAPADLKMLPHAA